MPMKRLPEYIISVLIFGLMMAAGIVVAIQMPVALQSNPIKIINFSYPASTNVCPGDFIPLQITLEIEGPSLTRIHTSVVDVAGNTMRGTEESMPPRPHIETVILRQTTNWVIPKTLAPGNYKRLTAMVVVNHDADPVFLSVPFTISPLCDRTNENE